MNNFEPKEIKLAAKHLKEKLELFKNIEENKEKNVYKVEDKKSSPMEKIINLIFKS